LPVQRDVNIGIYDLNGRLVWAKRLNAAETNMGENFAVWDLKNGQGVEAANGVYVLDIRSGGISVRKKIAVIK
jgi:flagellar hook assembly protein FlgD